MAMPSSRLLFPKIDGAQTIVEWRLESFVVDQIILVADSLLLGVAEQFGLCRAGWRRYNLESRIAVLVLCRLDCVKGAAQVAIIGVVDDDNGARSNNGSEGKEKLTGEVRLDGDKISQTGFRTGPNHQI